MTESAECRSSSRSCARPLERAAAGAVAVEQAGCSYNRYCRRVARSLAPGEWAVLAVVSEQPTHGFAVARALGPSGDIGRVWALSRPLVYRALDHLVDAHLVEKGAAEPSVRGPRRTSVRATTVGRRMVKRWLAEPVEHVRDVRSLLMLKLLFIERSGFDPKPLLDAQRDLLLPLAEALESRERGLSGFERTLVQWRLESTRAVLRFLAAARGAAERT